jgi:hypothetical protein
MHHPSIERTFPVLALMTGCALLAGLLLRGAPVRAAGPTVEQLAGELATLRSQVNTLQAQQGTRAAPAAADPLAALKTKVDQLGQVLQVSGNSVTLKSTGALTVDAAGGLTLKSAGQAQLESGAGLDIKSNGNASIGAAGTLNIKGASIRLNNGSQAAARVGSAVSGGVVNAGSATVLLP